MSAPLFTVIVPLAPGESEWAGLVADLQPIPDNWEMALAARRIRGNFRGIFCRGGALW